MSFKFADERCDAGRGGGKVSRERRGEREGRRDAWKRDAARGPGARRDGIGEVQGRD